MTNKKINVACFGEVLWDTFVDGNRRAGGAPFNVAYHLSKMGVEAYMISSIGDDRLGAELLEKIRNWNISTAGIQISDQFPTSQVLATMDENNEAQYEIVEGVAWDYIEALPQDKAKVSTMDALVFGTLAARNERSRNTLLELVEKSPFNVFDINLRPPHYDVTLIKQLLHKTQLAKFNKAELRLILDFLGKSYQDEVDSIRFIQDTFGIMEVIVSKGSKGALYVCKDAIYNYPTIPITVKDTVGSGDSFLAGFISKRLEKNSTAQEIMSNAVSLGAFITAQQGACPDYSLTDFLSFSDQNQVNPIKMDY
ncbi:carbohydrate kinase family protein [Algoriphagus aquimarinus]|uniref:Fructokinase n=1 Tax=Algoriphagus aquimarinus TaxID=237018 RepID=A0A1I0YUM1_9BACT|nr:carbohydrate kinase [Algoriphagus aquimarinus]SFB16984.1 fructokinase [Algoriphagus aquimarinus]